MLRRAAAPFRHHAAARRGAMQHAVRVAPAQRSAERMRVVRRGSVEDKERGRTAHPKGRVDLTGCVVHRVGREAARRATGGAAKRLVSAARAVECRKPRRAADG